MFGPIKNIVFDFDGTLVDSMGSVVEGLTEAIRHVTGSVVKREELSKTFGPPPLEVLRRWVPEAQLLEAHAHWLEFEKHAEISTFPGIEDLLRVLREKKIGLAVFTGRDRRGTLQIMRQRSWEFLETNLVCGDDGFPPKPAPDALESIMKKNNWLPSESLMVGDHPYDMEAGRRAGMKTGVALWDLPSGPFTRRRKFQMAWDAVAEVPHDVKLVEPGSLIRWIQER